MKINEALELAESNQIYCYPTQNQEFWDRMRDCQRVLARALRKALERIKKLEMRDGEAHENR